MNKEKYMIAKSVILNTKQQNRRSLFSIDLIISHKVAREYLVFLN